MLERKNNTNYFLKYEKTDSKVVLGTYSINTNLKLDCKKLRVGIYTKKTITSL